MTSFTLETTRHGDFVRFDLSLFGRATYGLGRMTTFDSAFCGSATTLFVNSYRWAPVPLTLVSEVGVLHSCMVHKHLGFHGSIVQPRASWQFRLGRWFVGGRTPAWVQRLLQRRDDRRWLDSEPPAEWFGDGNDYDDGDYGRF